MKAASSKAEDPELTNARIEEQFFRQFEKQIWPLLVRSGADSCLGCHDAENRSDLRFFPDALSNFKMLFENGYFSTEEPDALIGRLTSTHPKKQMPKGTSAPHWSENEIQSLRVFATNLNRQWPPARADERFPSALLNAYTGTPPSSLDNQFISFRQLKGKIKSIFNDDWRRNGRDLYQENIALFGGADFKERFNETTKPAATFLTGIDMLSRDVAARAFNQRTGPFAGRVEHLRSPLGMDGPDSAFQQEIVRLYRALLFRSPTAQDMKESFQLLQTIYRSENEIASSDFELAFALTVADEETGLTVARHVRIPVSGDPRRLHQEFIDQSAAVPTTVDDAAEDQKPAQRRNRKVSGEVARQKLSRMFRLKTRDERQVFRISNINTVGNVSFHSIELRLSGSSNAVQIIAATNAAVQIEGAWKFEDRRGLASFEDENNDKGNSAITVPLSVTQEGEYEMTVCWRKNLDNARDVLVEIFSASDGQLALPRRPLELPRGEAHFFIDQSEDTIAFADLNASFQFDETDYVEINNKGTRSRVTADAVKFISVRDKSTLLVDNNEAEGREQWKVYDSGQFRAYNQTGKNTYHDNNERKGELALRYMPSIKKETWKKDGFYQVHVGYPAKRDHEIRTPVIVKAHKSSPIVQIVHPARAQVDGDIQVDASASFTVQSSRLKFHWQQTAGPNIAVTNWETPELAFRVPRLSMDQAAWTALARALMRHPDFLFTRPPSLQTVRSGVDKARLQLVKIAQDLVARPPTAAEFAKLDSGSSLSQMIAQYLRAEEFQDFYFHRIRLYLESQGSEMQDEPVRLWCYIAFNDRPFQEILTADYTVDLQMRSQSRPAYHGRTGVLTTRGFIEGKPGLPHFNYAAQVAELFLGYVFEVPPEIVAQRDGITAVSTTDPASLCYSCHKVLTPLAFQRNRWDDQGNFRIHDEYGLPLDDSDQRLVRSYPFAGKGLEAFALQAAKKERFIRTIINTHFTFYFGREMRYRESERTFYKRVWDKVHEDNFAIRGLIKALLESREYLESGLAGTAVSQFPINRVQATAR